MIELTEVKLLGTPELIFGQVRMPIADRGRKRFEEIVFAYIQYDIGQRFRETPEPFAFAGELQQRVQDFLTAIKKDLRKLNFEAGELKAYGSNRLRDDLANAKFNLMAVLPSLVGEDSGWTGRGCRVALVGADELCRHAQCVAAD